MARQKTVRGLVVDDSRVARKILCQHLAERAPDLEIEQAACGREALDRFRTNPHDVVFLDMTMPEMDGVEVLRRIRLLGRRVVVIMVTGADDDTSRARAAGYGASAYMPKPYSSFDVARVLRLAIPQPPGIRLMAIDDSSVQRRVLQATLAAALPDAQFLEASNSVEGLRIALEYQPDLIFLDQNMPLLNGEHVLQELKTALPMTKVTMLSGETEPEFVERMTKLGADLVLPKPLEPTQLLTALFAMFE